MSTVYSTVEFQTESEKEYRILELIFKDCLDNQEHWPVEAYDPESHRIILKTVLATQPDVVGLAYVLKESFDEMAVSQEDSEVREKLYNISFLMECNTQYENCGEEINYLIRKNGREMTIQESENVEVYSGFSFDSYEDFCETVSITCPKVMELVSEQEWRDGSEFYVTYDMIYIDEEPELGEPYPLSEFEGYDDFDEDDEWDEEDDCEDDED